MEEEDESPTARESVASVAEPEPDERKLSSLTDIDPSLATIPVSVTKTREEEAIEAAEQRRLWAMAATSAAHLISEFTDKPIPDLETLKKTFAPASPLEWQRRKEASSVATILSEITGETEDPDGVSTDADFQGDLFFDTYANDDDLKEFLGTSDHEMFNENPAVQRKSSARLAQKKSLTGAQKVAFANKTVQAARKSLARLSMKRMSSVSRSPRQSKSIVEEKKESGISVEDSVLGEQIAKVSVDKGGGGKELGREDSRSRSSRSVSMSGMITDDDDWDFYDEKNEDEEDVQLVEEEGVYRTAVIDIDYYETSAGLEGLLEDLQLESRITERYKYMLINKFGILLQALLTSQEREMEVIEQLQTKHKILDILQQFLQAEAELSSKFGAAEEKSEEDQDVGMVLDFHSKDKKGEDSTSVVSASGTGSDGGTKNKHQHHDNQGLSIEEMSAGTIRETLLQQKNRLDVLEAIKRIHVLKLKQKDFEKTLLTLHYSRMVKPADLQKEIKEARKGVNELQVEISSMHQEMGQIQNKVKIQEKLCADEEKNVERLELEALTKQSEIALLQNKPIQVQKEADREAQKLEQLQDMHGNLCNKYMESMESFNMFEGKIDKLNSELGELVREETKLTTQKKNYIHDTEKLMTQMESLLTREHIMLDRSALIQEKISQAVKTKKKVHDETQRIVNEANKAVRITQRLERSIKLANESYINARLAHEKMRAAFDAAKPNDDQNSWIKLSKMLEREIVNLKTSLEKRLEDANIKAQLVERLKFQLNELYDEQVKAGKDLQDLIRTTVRKRREREEKSEQCIKLDAQVQKFDQDIKFRELAVEDCLRSEKDLIKHIDIYLQKSSILKIERSTIMNEVVLNKHKLTEVRETLKVLTQEVQMLTQRIISLEREFKGKQYLILSARIERDSARNEAFRTRDKFRVYRNQKDELLLGNKTLRRELERQKIDVVGIRKSFEKSLSESNSIAIQVRETIEEICTFNENIHVYDRILLRGAAEMSARELERIKLTSLYEELRKHVLIVKMNQPDESTFFDKIEKLRKYFYEITERRRALEVRFNEDDSPERVREIDFNLMKTRENVPALELILDRKETELATRDAIGLERTLMENHITKIVNDCLTRALHLKEFYNEQVKSMVHTRKSLGHLSRQIDGFICENSIAEAQAQTAEMKFLEFRKLVADAELNASKGLPPTEEIKHEWFETMRKKVLLQKARQKKPGFLRQVKPKGGTQIQAARLRGQRRALEDPQNSILGWNFGVLNATPISPVVSSQSLQFRNSATNPRRSSGKSQVPRLSTGSQKKSLI